MLATPLRAAVAVVTLPVRALRLVLPTPASEPLADATPAKAESARPARAGKYDVALIEIATKRPGITVAEAAGEIGVPASGLYPTIRRLEGQSRLEKRGRGLHSGSAAL